MSKHVANPATSQHIPQADGPILPSTRQHHGLGKAAKGPASQAELVSKVEWRPLISKEEETRTLALGHLPQASHLVNVHGCDSPRVTLQGEEAARILQAEHLNRNEC